MCVSGKFVNMGCAAPTQCFALPLVNKSGTSLACTTQDNAAARIADGRLALADSEWGGDLHDDLPRGDVDHGRVEGVVGDEGDVHRERVDWVDR